ncbi:MAG TPA: hypothetical protein VH280_07400 [Verrucomicrobiae bacterium]|jgi:hypothetical protein|nr:hypothetical protein [Verrucomicrobiae bacterium]
MLNLPASCPINPVIVGAIVTIVAWPVTVLLAYQSGLRTQRKRVEWEAQKAKQDFRKAFFDSANRFKTNVSISENPNNWVDFFKDNVRKLISDYEMIRPDLKWKDKKRMDEAMNSIKRYAPMNEREIRDACRHDNELFDALKKFPEV